MKMNKKLLRTRRKQKSIAPKYAPVFINSQQNETQATLVWRLAVKIFLVCLSASGLGVTLAQIYKIPVSLGAVVLTCFATVTILNVGLLIFKKRALIIPLALFLILSSADEIVHSVYLFLNYMFYVLNSRLLSTARYAVYTQNQLAFWENQQAIAAVFLVLCVLISLVFTLGARSRFIGIMLISTVFLMTPAFGAEIAGYVSGMNILVAGMAGIYTMWVAHAWENLGGIHQINYTNKDKVNQLGKAGKPEKVERDPNLPREPIYKITPGSLPYFYKYSRNSVIGAFLAVFAVFAASTAIPEAIKFDYQTIVGTIRDFPVRAPESVRRFFKYNFGSINDNGFFPNISTGTNISTGINMNRPPTGSIPIIRVTLEDDSEKIYLRGGIGIDLNGDEWTIVHDSDEYEQLLQLLQEFTPELEYHAFRRKQQIIESDINDIFPALIERQTVQVDYLARTGFLLLPTQPFHPDFKSNSDFSWHGDTFIRPSGRVSSSTFDVLYPRMSRNIEFSHVYQFYLQGRERDWFRNVIFNFPDDTTTREFNEQIALYRELIHSIYMGIPENEIENIDRFLGYLPAMELYNTPLEYIQEIHDFLRHNYAYSLEIDNTVGNNTSVGTFLHETYQGHCAMYASSMVLAARRVGFPARYVTGIVTVPGEGERVGYGQGFEHIMAERDFHAWVEVYFEGIGWLPFDPTGGAHGQDGGTHELPHHATEPTEPVATNTAPPSDWTTPPDRTTPSGDVTTTPATGNGVGQNGEGEGEGTPVNLGAVIAVVLILLVLIVMVGGAVIFLKSLEKAESQKLARFKNAKNTDLNSTADEMYRFMFRLLKSEGIRTLSGEPPLEFGERVDREMQLSQIGDESSPTLSLSEIMPVFEKLEFSDTESAENVLTREEYESLYEYVAALYEKVVFVRKPVERVVKRFKFGR
jgi:transglutaminase-like putative cysteine protease